MSTLAKILLDHFENHPEQVAIYLQTAGHEDLPISYKKLIEQAGAYADLYASRRILPGEVVILILEHGEALIYSFYGAILHGAIPSIMPFSVRNVMIEGIAPCKIAP